MSQYLLEIGMEEIPARFLLDLSQQLASRFTTFLTDQRLSYQTIKSYATPRRLALIVEGLAEFQTDKTEKVKGPALKIAQTEDGQWTKAALGFAKSQGVHETELVIEDLEGQAYVFANKFEKGLAASQVLTQVDQVIKAMTFPVTMLWHTNEVPFIRPVHWLISLLDEEVLPLEFVGIQSGRTSYGHRFLGGSVEIQQPSDYVAALKSVFVIADFAERQTLIQQQIEAIAQAHQWQVPIDSALLEEVTAIVEWPTAFFGTFDEKYLQVPSSVLITAMRDHQRYFYAEDKITHQLLPVFISVRNGNDYQIENVVNGNHKVLVARLEDALFFYQEDLKLPLDHFLEKLAKVNEHFKLGSLADKQQRVGQIVQEVGKQLSLGQPDLADAHAASQIYKYDLMTNMVGEFDELQGQIGQIYAPHYGISTGVATAIGSQYLPTTSGGSLPTSQAGALLALSDKIDTLIQYFSVKLIPTGSNDPYALRRQATGIVEIILDRTWSLDLIPIFQTLVAQFVPQAEGYELVAQLVDFIQARLSKHLEKLAIDFDVIQSVIKVNQLNLVQIVTAAQFLQALKLNEADTYRNMVEAITRVANMGTTFEVAPQVELDLAQSDSEKALITAALGLDMQDPIGSRLAQLRQLSPLINQYFEDHIINAEDEAIRINRQGLMVYFTHYMRVALDPSLLINKF